MRSLARTPAVRRSIYLSAALFDSFSLVAHVVLVDCGQNSSSLLLAVLLIRWEEDCVQCEHEMCDYGTGSPLPGHVVAGKLHRWEFPLMRLLCTGIHLNQGLQNINRRSTFPPKQPPLQCDYTTSTSQARITIAKTSSNQARAIS